MGRLITAILILGLIILAMIIFYVHFMQDSVDPFVRAAKENVTAYHSVPDYKVNGQ
ncbi:MAG: hypothetical protein NT088_04605 [Candidatus Omnitrophica bacterium]|nr:hypothetical protein [Candidatus Omnitrophota bacterium]